MNNYSRAKTIQYYFERIDSGAMEFDEMRKELNTKQLEKKEINVIVRQVDKRLLRVADLRASRNIGRGLFYGGWIFFVVGVILTIAAFAGLLSGGRTYIIFLSPIFTGLSLALLGWKKMNRQEFFLKE
ncbi:MAG: hypothetical protein MK212_04000 [Saprospiraceae bacterium]|nr:hypothetical protein [Saprospiraceae bacterium]